MLAPLLLVEYLATVKVLWGGPRSTLGAWCVRVLCALYWLCLGSRREMVEADQVTRWLCLTLSTVYHRVSQPFSILVTLANESHSFLEGGAGTEPG